MRQDRLAGAEQRLEERVKDAQGRVDASQQELAAAKAGHEAEVGPNICLSVTTFV